MQLTELFDGVRGELRSRVSVVHVYDQSSGRLRSKRPAGAKLTFQEFGRLFLLARSLSRSAMLRILIPASYPLENVN